MKRPSGAVTSRIATMYTPIWSHPLAVIRISLAPAARRRDTRRAARTPRVRRPDRWSCHDPFFLRRSHPTTYARAIAKKARVTTMNTRSSTRPPVFIQVDQNFTRIANVTRLSVLRKSGVQNEPAVGPGTSALGLPLFPPGGVTPPAPVKYGTLAARWTNSPRNVRNWLGM